MKTLTLQRKEYRSDGIFSLLSDERGKLIAHTLEHAYPENADFRPKIPAGLFTCCKGMHRLHPDKPYFQTFEVTGVIGHEGILIHRGNTQADSKGCILLGETVCQSALGQEIASSREAFEAFMQLMKEDESFYLKVID